MYIGTYTYTYRESYTITYISAFWENKLEKMMNKNNTNWALPLSVSLPPPSLKTFLATIHLENDLFLFSNFFSLQFLFNLIFQPTLWALPFLSPTPPTISFFLHIPPFYKLFYHPLFFNTRYIFSSLFS